MSHYFIWKSPKSYKPINSFTVTTVFPLLLFCLCTQTDTPHSHFLNPTTSYDIVGVPSFQIVPNWGNAGISTQMRTMPSSPTSVPNFVISTLSQICVFLSLPQSFLSHFCQQRISEYAHRNSCINSVLYCSMHKSSNWFFPKRDRYLIIAICGSQCHFLICEIKFIDNITYLIIQFQIIYYKSKL